MKLIIGGAWQGKLDFARERFGFSDSDIFSCEGTDMDFSKPCIYGLQKYTLACVREGLDPLTEFSACRERWENSVLIMEDIFCGVVPMGAEVRAWRQATGRLCRYLADEAQSVSRIFCGLEQRLK